MEMNQIIVYAVMAVGLLGVIYFATASKKNPSLKAGLYVSFIIVLGGIIANIFISPEASEDKRFNRNAKIIQDAQALKIAEYIKENWESPKVIFLANEKTFEQQSEEAYLDKYLMKQIQNNLSSAGIDFEDDPIYVGKTETVKSKDGGDDFSFENPTDATVMAKQLKNQIDKADVAINFVGLSDTPGDIEKINYLTKKTKTKKNCMIVTNEQGMRQIDVEMIKSGRVAFFIPDNHDQNFDYQKENAPKNPGECFDRFFSIVDKNTFESFSSANPKIFQKDE